jgi:hypothetical protein
MEIIRARVTSPARRAKVPCRLSRRPAKRANDRMKKIDASPTSFRQFFERA